MYETLLVLHLLSAAALVAAMAYFSALFVGAPLIASHYRFANVLVGAGAGLVLVFGVWLALYVDGYEIWDAWILISIVLWAVSGAAGSRAGKAVQEQVDAGGTVDVRAAATMHWIALAAVFGILVLMIFKPGA